MIRSRAARVAGFATAVAATAALIAFGVSSTGAYFTDSHDGTINAGTGSVKLGVDQTTLNFAGLMPGQFKNQTITYQNNGTANEDIWLVFPTDGSADALNGTPRPGPIPLGRYGHFAVSGPEGTYFTSFNLASAPTSAGPSCQVNATTGHGGSNSQATSPSVYPNYCPVPDAILLHSGLAPTATNWATITFGFTRLLTAPQGAPLSLVAPFKIVATQPGILPSDPNN